MSRRISLTDFERRVLQFEPDLRKAYVRALRASALRLEGMVVEEIDRAEPYPAVDTGELRRSVDTTFVEDGAIVAVNAPHAAAMEYGARPHRPPYQAILEWVRRKRLDVIFGPRERDRWVSAKKQSLNAQRVAFLICRAIEARGIAPRQFFAKAWARIPPVIRIEVWKALANLSGSR